MKILIAEDDMTSLSILTAILRKWDFDPIPAEDGEVAWEIIQKTDALNLAIIDWNMPGIDGLTLCRKIKALNLVTPIYVILLTGRDTKEDIVKGLDAGADDYITKPFDNNELRSRVDVAERMVSVQKTLANKIEELQEALDHVKVLQGTIPICMHCHQIRSDNQAWNKLETYISNHSDAEFSHSICPECLEQHYPEE